MFFTASEREKIKTANPELGFGEVSKKLGEMWKSMDTEARAPYETLATEDKKRFKTETEAYEALKAEALAMSDSSDDDDAKPAAAGGDAMADSDSD